MQAFSVFPEPDVPSEASCAAHEPELLVGVAWPHGPGGIGHHRAAPGACGTGTRADAHGVCRQDLLLAPNWSRFAPTSPRE